MEIAFVAIRRNVGASGGTPTSAFHEYPIAADGAWSGEFVVPPTMPPGAYFLGMHCRASDMLRQGPEVDDYLVVDQPPAVVTAARDGADPSLLAVAVRDCRFEDGAAAVEATFTAANSTGVAATATVPVLPDGTGATTLRVPGGTGALTVNARCTGPAGAMVAVPAEVAALPVAPLPLEPPPPLARTG